MNVEFVNERLRHCRSWKPMLQTIKHIRCTLPTHRAIPPRCPKSDSHFNQTFDKSQRQSSSNALAARFCITGLQSTQLCYTLSTRSLPPKTSWQWSISRIWIVPSKTKHHIPVSPSLKSPTQHCSMCNPNLQEPLHCGPVLHTLQIPHAPVGQITFTCYNHP